MSYVELTLASGEKVLFGKGIVNSGDQIPTPGTYDVNKIVALAFPKSASDGGKPTHGIASFVDPNGALHHKYMWAPDEVWEGPGQAFIFGMMNNAGTWRSNGNGWFSCPLPDGRVLAIGGQSIYPAMPNAFYGVSKLPQVVGNTVPAMPGMSSRYLQAMPVTDGFDYIGDDAAHGVKDCSVDPGTLQVTAQFEDGEGNIWGGSASVFSVLCDTPTGAVAGNVIPADATRWPGSGAALE